MKSGGRVACDIGRGAGGNALPLDTMVTALTPAQSVPLAALAVQFMIDGMCALIAGQ